MCGLFGIFITSKTKIFSWLSSSFGLLFFAFFCAIALTSLLQKLGKDHLFIFYLALLFALIYLFVFLREFFKAINSNKPIIFIFLISLFWLVFFHFPLIEFIRSNLSLNSFSTALLFVSLLLFLFALTALLPLLLALISFKLTKIYFVLFFVANSLAVYFVSSYGVFLDKTMMGNLFNTNVSEASSFLSLKMALWVLVLGLVPAYFVLNLKLENPTRKTIAKFSGFTLLTLLFLAGINYKNLLWFDKHSKQLGALIMPYSYTINSARFFQGEFAKNKKEILLPKAQIIDDKKAVVVLVIGESARLKNFSLYGYERDTNPLLSKLSNLRHFYAKSSTTYTSASVKNMLSHKDSTTLYEILPNYLFRTGVSVFWRSSNWGAPPLHFANIAEYNELSKRYAKFDDGYESALIANLGEEIRDANSSKVLVVLHTSTSHGPSYYKKYPVEFEKFSPVCKSVEPKGCLQGELINAYDNTVLYTDFLLNSIIEQLAGLKDYDRAMIYASDHGESLGENGLYMHGIPMAFAPKEQYEIPFLVWSSKPDSVKNLKELSHFHIFHSVLAFLGIQSEVFDEGLNLFEKTLFEKER
ncbi:phosphoethanolamine--lipid A transferase EptA [Campylobacter troglodytis]|nr:phosphoethanolamine--lipid A transferase EptA [Campylobacter troglodytis]